MVRAVYEGRDSELVAHTPPLLWPTRTIRSGENGSQSRSVQSCPHLPTTREVYEPMVYQLGIAEGIVKYGSPQRTGVGREGTSPRPGRTLARERQLVVAVTLAA